MGAMRGPLLWLVLALCAAMAQAADSRRVPIPAAIAINRLATPPAIDGKLDGAEWRSATRVARFVHTAGASARLKNQTEVRLGYDDKALYVGFRCHESQMGKLVARGTGEGSLKLFKDDSVELFVCPDAEQLAYCHFATNSLGTRFAETGQSGAPPKGDWTVKTSRGKDSWVAELAIPFATLGLKGTLPDGRLIRLNLCRGEQPAGELSQWCPTGGAFHRPELFGLAHLGSALPCLLKGVSLARGPHNDYLLKTKVVCHEDVRGPVAVALSLGSGDQRLSGTATMSVAAGSEQPLEIRLVVPRAGAYQGFLSLRQAGTGELCYVLPLCLTLRGKEGAEPFQVSTGRLPRKLRWLQHERLRGTLFHRPNVVPLEPVHLEAAAEPAARGQATLALRGQHFISVLVGKERSIRFRLETVETHKLCPFSTYAIFGPQGETIATGKVATGKSRRIRVRVAGPGRYVLLLNSGIASHSVARLSVSDLPWALEGKTRRAYMRSPLKYHFLRELKLAGLTLVMLDFETLRQEFVTDEGLKGWTDKVAVWADHARRYKIRLMPALNIGGTSYEVEAWGDARKGLYIEHLKDKPLAPCPLGRAYWERLLLRRGRQVARLSTRNPYVVGIGIDPEMYACHAYGPYKLSGTCFCDHCFGGFLRHKGLDPQQLATGKARHQWLTKGKLMGDYYAYLEDEMAELAGWLRDELHKINPNFLICVYVLDIGNWFCRGVSRGFGSDRVPAVNFSEHTYYGVGYDPAYIERTNKAFRDWGANVVPGYAVWDVYFPPTRRAYLAAHCYNLAMGGGGYWTWPGCDLLLGDVWGRLWAYQGKVAVQPDYWLALRDANSEIDRSMARGTKYASPLEGFESVPWRGAYVERKGMWKEGSGVERIKQPVYPIHIAGPCELRFLVPERTRTFAVLARADGGFGTLKVVSPGQRLAGEASCAPGQDVRLDVAVTGKDKPGLWTLKIEAPEGGLRLDLKDVPSYLTPTGVPALVPQVKRGDVLGRWRFDEGKGDLAADASGPPAYNGTVHHAEWVKGKRGLALSFDGKRSHVRIPHSWSMDNLDEYTLSAWVNLRSLPAKGHGFTITGKGPEAPVQHFWWWIGYGHELVLEVGSKKHRWGAPFATARLPWELGRWYHVAVTCRCDGKSTTASFYRDGKLLSTATKHEPFHSGSHDLLIGSYHGGSAHVFDGKIDEVTLHKRALGPQEIRTVAAQTGGRE